jgi:hypothetical protein
VLGVNPKAIPALKKDFVNMLNKTTDHPWEHIFDMELFKSAGLYEENWVTSPAAAGA